MCLRRTWARINRVVTCNLILFIQYFTQGLNEFEWVIRLHQKFEYLKSNFVFDKKTRVD